MLRRIRDLALAVVGVALLVGALTLLDERVPAHVLGTAREVSSGHWTNAGGPVARVVVDAASSPELDDAFLFAMLGAGVILVILMLRT